MLTDYKVISQILSQFFSTAMLCYAGVLGSQAIRHWNLTQSTEKQLFIERQSYLIGMMMQFVYGLQVMSLLLFLSTANVHLPSVIKGAMCASGTLSANEYGFPLLYFKIVALVFYAVFAILNYLDNDRPNFPYSPKKYYWIIPAALLSMAEMILLVSYFYHITPDVITTCCSVSVSEAQNMWLDTTQGMYAQGMSGFFVVLGIFLVVVLLFFPNQNLVLGIGILLFLSSGTYALKYHYTKYIYGLATHFCLYDLFFLKYYGLGYVFLLGAYSLVFLYIFRVILHQNQQIDTIQYPHYQKKIKFFMLLCIGISVGLPLFFEWTWRGDF